MTQQTELRAQGHILIVSALLSRPGKLNDLPAELRLERALFSIIGA